MVVSVAISSSFVSPLIRSINFCCEASRIKSFSHIAMEVLEHSLFYSSQERIASRYVWLSLGEAYCKARATPDWRRRYS